MLMAIFVYFMRRMEKERCQSYVDVLGLSGHEQRKCLRKALGNYGPIVICRECALAHELIDEETKMAVVRRGR